MVFFLFKIEFLICLVQWHLETAPLSLEIVFWEDEWTCIGNCSLVRHKTRQELLEKPWQLSDTDNECPENFPIEIIALHKNFYKNAWFYIAKQLNIYIYIYAKNTIPTRKLFLISIIRLLNLFRQTTQSKIDYSIMIKVRFIKKNEYKNYLS